MSPKGKNIFDVLGQKIGILCRGFPTLFPSGIVPQVTETSQPDMFHMFGVPHMVVSSGMLVWMSDFSIFWFHVIYL